MINLSSLPLEVKAIIVGFEDTFVEEKLIEMGIVEGDEIIVLKKAPLNDPIFIQSGNSQLGLRVSEAKTIMVDKIA